MTKLLTTLLFGPRAAGQPIPQPKFKTCAPASRPSEGEWVAEFKVGSRYGHRGSFYENNFRVTVA